MTERDPPRLRTLRERLPPDLALALAPAREDEPTPDELRAFEAQLARALAERETGNSRRFTARRRAPRARVASLVLMFTLGAGAGVLVSGGVFVVSRSRVVEAQKPPRPTSGDDTKHPARPRPSPARVAPSAGVEATPTASVTPPPVSSQDPARLPAQNPGIDLPSTAPSAAHAEGRDEFALIARAQRALATNPGLALALTSDHERKFPGGALVQEREVVAIDALLRLGRRAEASERALRFRREFPLSVHQHRLDVLLGGDSTSSDHN
jgi:hypothetical protein